MGSCGGKCCAAGADETQKPPPNGDLKHFSCKPEQDSGPAAVSSPSSSCMQPTVLEALSYKMSDESGVTEEAVVSLFKKLTWYDLSVLLKALSSCKAETMCVLLDRLYDVDIQVQHRIAIGHPHTIYCRIWRWQDLESERELKALYVCEHAFSHSKDILQVCINPYHYERITAKELLPVVVPSDVTYTIASAPEPGSDAAETVELAVTSYEPATIPSPLSGCSGNLTPIFYEEPTHWCSIKYFELDHQIGVFHASSSTIFVHGYTDPNYAHHQFCFCVGHLSNINRNLTISKTRQHIGSGVELVYTCGNVFIQCLSSSPIFIQSRFYNQINGYKPTDVYKLYPGEELKIFDNQQFAVILSSQTFQESNSFSELCELCVVSISFAKGWGKARSENNHVYHRQRINETPCWLKIKMRGAFMWINRVLLQMKQQSSCD